MKYSTYWPGSPAHCRAADEVRHASKAFPFPSTKTPFRNSLYFDRPFCMLRPHVYIVIYSLQVQQHGIMQHHGVYQRGPAMKNPPASAYREAKPTMPNHHCAGRQKTWFFPKRGSNMRPVRTPTHSYNRVLFKFRGIYLALRGCLVPQLLQDNPGTLAPDSAIRPWKAP